MAITVDTKKTHEYVLKADRKVNDTERTVFLIKTLTAREMSMVMSIAQNHTDIKKTDLEKLTDDMIRICKLGVAGWNNFKDSNGNNILFKHDDAVFNLISFQDIHELATAVIELNSVMGQDSKNSKSPQGS